MNDFRGKTITAPLIWYEGRFQAGVQIQVDEAGNIADIGPSLVPESQLVHIQNAALVPGFINAHSHAFHRYLRGRSGIGGLRTDNFWKWRDEMYKLVEEISFDKLKEYCKGTFSEMLAAGITTVGEFHYVHHSNCRFDLDMAVVEAARETGIRLVLLNTIYSRGSFQSNELNVTQQRFGSELAEFQGYMANLEKRIQEHSDVSLAIAAHSLRAVRPDDLQKLWNWAVESKKALHIHIEEQPKEIEECLDAEGKTPLRILLDKTGDGTSKTPLTAVHCTFSKRKSLDEFCAKGYVCICPTTEGFLGDGIPSLDEVDRLCLGTDCNNRISFLEEMRWLSFCQNMKNNSRSCAGLDAEKLLKIATENGASSLGLNDKTGRFEKEKRMDFVAFDLISQRLREFSESNHLLDAIVFGCGNAEILMTGVSGIVRFKK